MTDGTPHPAQDTQSLVCDILPYKYNSTKEGRLSGSANPVKPSYIRYCIALVGRLSSCALPLPLLGIFQVFLYRIKLWNWIFAN